jgi:molybdopterin/thiamine biosynthesis adenylyltransferase
MNTLIIGAGGIGSYFAATLDNLIDNDQFDSNWEFTITDDDNVELKNIRYQNFKSQDIDSSKVDALSDRYLNLEYEQKRVTLDDISEYDLIIICADNNIIRREAWTNWKENKIPFIDSRSNGRAVGLFSSDTKNYLNTIDESTESFSCQFPYQLAKNEIELGNRIIANILAQALLTYSRNNTLPSDLNHIF